MGAEKNAKVEGAFWGMARLNCAAQLRRSLQNGRLWELLGSCALAARDLYSPATLLFTCQRTTPPPLPGALRARVTNGATSFDRTALALAPGAKKLLRQTR